MAIDVRHVVPPYAGVQEKAAELWVRQRDDSVDRDVTAWRDAANVWRVWPCVAEFLDDEGALWRRIFKEGKATLLLVDGVSDVKVYRDTWRVIGTSGGEALVRAVGEFLDQFADQFDALWSYCEEQVGH